MTGATGTLNAHDDAAPVAGDAWAQYWCAYATEREQIFAAAGRHSARVRWLKRGIVFSAFAMTAGLVLASLFNPLGGLPGVFAIDRATLNGTRITMDQPRMNGFRKDGKPYTVRARTGIQDVRTPGVIELNEVVAKIEVGDTNTVDVLAPAGVFDAGADRLQLKAPDSAGFISVKSTSGFDIRMRSADMNVKTGHVVSNEPVNVRMTNGTIDAARLEVTDNGKVISFSGQVRSLFRQPAQDEPAVPEPDKPAPAGSTAAPAQREVVQ